MSTQAAPRRPGPDQHADERFAEALGYTGQLYATAARMTRNPADALGSPPRRPRGHDIARGPQTARSAPDSALH
jgi:hypothetical protein